jgi:molecular chaperone GrpE
MPSSPESETGAGPAPSRSERAEQAPVEGGAALVPEPPDVEAVPADPTGELARIEDLYKRALADLDNYRKRSAREVERRVLEVRASIVHDWLDAVDSVERAVQLEPDGQCREGLQAILQQMEAVLARQGAERIGVPGEPFDPARHEAVAVREAQDVPDRTVVEVQRSGYGLGDRVIRPAQVAVARAPDHAH